jgi:hypothetical protein
LVLGLLLATAVARADAVVEVELRDAKGKPAEGEVWLADKNGKRVAGCKTKAGRCDMTGVAGGSYKAHVEPAKDSKAKAPKPRSVMIPPAGKVSLIVSTEE